MDFQRIKAIILLLIGVLFVVGVTYFATVKVIIPQKEKQLTQQVVAQQKLKKVVVAKNQIPMGTKITDDMLDYKDVPQSNLMDNFITSKNDVVGKTAKANIYINEQITTDRLDANAEIPEKNKDKFLTPEEITKEKELQPSHRYITIDIPRYNFVNGSVKKGSLVDILVENGRGQYDVVLAKVTILDLKEVGGDSSSDKSSKKDNKVEIQPKRILPAAILGPDGKPLVKSDLATTETEDYRITLRITEKEHRRVVLASTLGKFLTREYVSESQPKSKITFDTTYENTMVAGDGTVPPQRPAANKTPDSNTTNSTTTNTQPTGR